MAGRVAEEGNFPIKLLQSNRASAILRAAVRFRVQNYVPFFFSALFSFSTSEVPGSPPSTSLARQALGHRCHARIASATLFLFGGVDDGFALSFAAAATESMAASPAQRRTTGGGAAGAARNGPRGCQLVGSLAFTGRRRRAPLVFVMKDPPPEGLLVASHAPTSRVWEPVRAARASAGASAKLALFELLDVRRLWHGLRGLVSARVSQRRVFRPIVHISARKRTTTRLRAMFFTKVLITSSSSAPAYLAN